MIHLLNANALHIPLADGCVQCVITSPPYWGLRDYGTAEWVGGDAECDHVANPNATKKMGNPIFNENRPSRENTITAGYYADHCPKCGAIRKDAQLGLEPTPAEYLANMVAVFREVWRVLADDGVIWVNMGDSYAAGGGSDNQRLDRLGEKMGTGGGHKHSSMKSGRAPTPKGIPPKNLVGIPWRLAFALQDDGWILRSDIIWHKPNPMPESVTDRPTKAHEYIFLLSKKSRYFFDNDAIREGVAQPGVVQAPDVPNQLGALFQDIVPKSGHPAVKIAINLAASIFNISKSQRDGRLPSFDSKIGKYGTNKIASSLVSNGPVVRRATAQASAFSNGDISAKHFLYEFYSLWITLPNGDKLKEAGRSSLFHIGLIDADGNTTISINDTSDVGQIMCIHDEKYTTPHTSLSHPKGRNRRTVWTVATQPYSGAHFATFPTALVEPMVLAGSRPGDLVMDPFSGTATAGTVARKHHRRYVGLELNPEYIKLAKERTRTIQPTLFNMGAL